MEPGFPLIYAYRKAKAAADAAEFESHVSVFPHCGSLSTLSAGTSFPEICRNVSILPSLSGLLEIGSSSGWGPWIDKVHSHCHRETSSGYL